PLSGTSSRSSKPNMADQSGSSSYAAITSGDERSISNHATRVYASGMDDSLALVLTGGGARAAYQVGVLRCLARRLPKLRLDVVTGVSAGAINALFLASRHAPLRDVVEELRDIWRALELKDVIRIDSRSLARNVF